MAYISNEVMNEIRNKTDIVDVISKYVNLTKKGKNYFGVCPFHDDHSPSMSVSPEKQIYTCFSCGASGNVFTFVADFEKISFTEAVRLLGEKVGINIGTNISVSNKKDEYFDIYSTANKFYQNSLFTNLGKNAIEYLDKRHIDKDTIKKFGIGLSIQKVSLTEYLINKKYSIDVNSSLNFINGRTNEKVYYDEMKIGYYIDTYTYKKSKAISILSNIKGEELRKELIKNLTLEDSPYLTVSPIGTNIEIINSNKAILTITFEDLIPDYNVDGGKFEMKVEINSNTVIERKGGRNKIEQLKDADLNIIKIRLDKNTINNEIPIATYFMSSDGN